MTSNTFCCPYANGVCPYKKEYLSFSKTAKCPYSCSAQDKKDYQQSQAKYFNLTKLKNFTKSTCPMVSINWLENQIINYQQ